MTQTDDPSDDPSDCWTHQIPCELTLRSFFEARECDLGSTARVFIPQNDNKAFSRNFQRRCPVKWVDETTRVAGCWIWDPRCHTRLGQGQSVVLSCVSSCCQKAKKPTSKEQGNFPCVVGGKETTCFSSACVCVVKHVAKTLFAHLTSPSPRRG